MSDIDKLIQDGKKPLSLEQAINYLMEHRKKVAKDIREQAQKSHITIAPVNDRIKYLEYCITLLEIVDEDLMRLMPVNIRTMYSRHEMAQFFRWFLRQKIYYATDEQLSFEVGVPVELIKSIDVYAQEACYRSIKKVRAEGIPLVNAG